MLACGTRGTHRISVHDTLTHMQKPENPNAFWEITVPNGSYSVRIVAGDPSHDNSVYRIGVEGTLAIAGTPSSATLWFDNTVTVTVSDGRLTIANAAGALNNKICFVEIYTGSGPPPPPPPDPSHCPPPPPPPPPPSADAVRINFQPAGVTPPTGYLVDGGSAFGSRGNGQTYGWNADNTAHARIRGDSSSPDRRYDTLDHMQKPENPNALWEIAIPNGSYSVRLVAGDPWYSSSVFRISVEGTLAIAGTSSSTTLWFDSTVTVTVGDGRLTIASAAGASNNKICFVEIRAL